MATTHAPQINVAEAKRQFSDLLGRVAYRGETVVITRRGKPMAKLVPPAFQEDAGHLGNVKGWLDAECPYFTTLDEIVAARARSPPPP